MNASMTSTVEKAPVWKMAFLSFLVICFLGFIDEGAHNFEWARNPGNWIALSIYFIPILSLQVILYTFVFKKQENTLRLLLSFLVSTALGITLTALFFLYVRQLL